MAIYCVGDVQGCYDELRRLLGKVAGAGVQVVAGSRQGVTELTLKILQERTPFIRCHRQYLVNVSQIAEIELLENGGAEILTRSGQRLPVSRRYLRDIKDRLHII